MPCSFYRPVSEFCGQEECVRSIGKCFLGVAVTAAALFSICCDSPPALAESLTVAFPVSRAREVFDFCLILINWIFNH